MPTLTQEQIEFRAYLRRELPMALARVARAPRMYRSESRHVEADGGIILQPEELRRLTGPTRGAPEMESHLLAVGLYWMVSIDEAMWTYHRAAYPRFRELTYFPKLVGDCPGGCGTHLHPTAALQLVGGPEGNWMHTRLTRTSLLAWSVPAVQDILERLGRLHDLPMLPQLVNRDCEELGLPMPSHRGMGIPVEDPIPAHQPIEWRVPRVTQEVLDATAARAEEARGRAHPTWVVRQ